MNPRRQFLVSASTFIAGLAFDAPRVARSFSPVFAHRGFTVDVTAAQNAPNLEAIVESLRHQIDIIADCGAAPKIIDFFKSQTIFLKAGTQDGGGHFSADSKGVALDIAVQAPQKPVALHEMLHAFHYWALPGRSQNPDVLRFYQRARQGGFYQPSDYVMKNQREFFAVTGSLYLGAMSIARRTTARPCTTTSRSITNGSATCSGW